MPPGRLQKLPFEQLVPFEQRIWLLARAQRKTPSALGVAAGLSDATVNTWCTRAVREGKPPPPSKELQALADLCKTSTAWLRDWTPLDVNAPIPGPEWPNLSASLGSSVIDTTEHRQLIAAALEGAGIDRGIAADAALKSKFRVIEEVPLAVREALASTYQTSGVYPSISPEVRSAADRQRDKLTQHTRGRRTKRAVK